MSRADYAPSSERVPAGGAVKSVESDSPAARAGLIAGDVLVTADGHPLGDVLDWRWYSDGAAVSVEVRDHTGGLRACEIIREPGEAWGVDFADPLFDGVRRCANACTFCFMTQLPPGMRRALYIRDDDFRLSFLQGNFITLTNLTEADVERIADQNLSPLYVSLHAVTPAVRERMICASHDVALERFDQLVEAGIDLHVQVVLVPGVNDGDELEQTLTWLAEREGVLSVGVVPLGYTRHQNRFACGYEDPIAAATVIQQVQRWQFAMRERDKVSWVHLADEFYLNARAPFPTTEWCDGFPQYENGIGIVRSFGDEASALREECGRAVDAIPEGSEAATVVTGMMSATTLAGALNAFEAAGRVRLLVVPNRFFGGNVSVTGLLTGEDLAAAIRADSESLERPTAYLLPDIVFNSDGVTLDDLDAAAISTGSDADVRVVSCDAAGLLAGLSGVAENPPVSMKE